MEEGGHYYTVYYTSLAVGTTHATAFRHALLAQMPDEVGRMDAANMQMKEITGIREYDFNNVLRYVPINERYAVQYGLHSLPGNQLSNVTKSSDFQRRYTTERLNSENINSLEFGLLLHRLGDSYAHSRIGNESVMYQVTPKSSGNLGNMGPGRNDYGHLSDGHDPDFAFLRPSLFYSYLQNLYTVLSDKLREPANASFRRPHNVAKTFVEIRAAFSDIFANIESRANTYNHEQLVQASRRTRDDGGFVRLATNDMKARWMIQEIRNASERILGIRLMDYNPENQDAMPLRNFLRNHPSLNDLNINNNSLVRAIENDIPGGGRGLLDVPPPPPPVDYQPYYGY